MTLPVNGYIQQVEVVVGGTLPRAGYVQPVESSGAAGLVTGSGAAGQVTFWTGAQTVSGSASLTWDNTNVALTVDGARLFVAGTNSMFLGETAGNFTTTSTGSLGVGYKALNSLTSGSDNVAIGYEALFSAATVRNSTAVGFQALRNSNAAIGENTAVGFQALYNTTSGPDNTAVGYAALYSNVSGANNGAHGYTAQYSNQDGDANVALGDTALYTNVHGDNNIAIGHAAGYLATGSNNVFIGYSAGYNETGNNKLYIAHTSTTTPLIYGDFGSTYVNINSLLGVNLATATAPARKLEVLDGSGANQLRLTYTAGSKYVEWGSTAAGDMQVTTITGTTNLDSGSATVTLNVGNSQIVSTSGGSLHIVAGAQTNNNVIIDPISTGAVYLSFVSGTGGVNFGDGAAGIVASIASNGDLRFGSSADVVLHRSGSKSLQILTDSTGSLGFFNASAVTKQTAAGDTNYSDSGATVVHSAGTFTGGTGSTAYTIGDIVKALKNYGLLVT